MAPPTASSRPRLGRLTTGAGEPLPPKEGFGAPKAAKKSAVGLGVHSIRILGPGFSGSARTGSRGRWAQEALGRQVTGRSPGGPLSTSRAKPAWRPRKGQGGGRCIPPHSLGDRERWEEEAVAGTAKRRGAGEHGPIPIGLLARKTHL